MYCTHGRLSDGCEDCSLVTAMERGHRPTPLPSFPVPALEVAEADLFIDRSDGVFTFIKSGEPIPANFSGLPRIPAPARPLTNADTVDGLVAAMAVGGRR